jgi:hypothetical protein
MIDPTAYAVLRIALALLLLAAAFHKLRDLHAFRVALGDYELVSWSLTGLLAPGLVAAELAVGAALLSPWAQPLGFAAAALLLALYTAAIVANLVRGRRDIDCGCFGPALRAELGGALVARNVVLLGGAAIGSLPVAPRALGALDAVTIAGGVAFATCAYAATSRLLANAPALRAQGGRLETRPTRSEPQASGAHQLGSGS